MMLNCENWEVEEACQYLQQELEDLGDWEAEFRKKNITGSGLRYITDDDLKNLGIKNLGDRQKILHSASKLTEQGKSTVKDETWKMKMRKITVFNDPIHGTVELPPLIIKIIDTTQFQRLRYIKQLGGAYFVYPGASHNRFEHSIGVAHLAGELAKALCTRQPELCITAKDILCVQIAGLCHDLGHGPFSHLFDGMFVPQVCPKKKWKHEQASVSMFDHLVEVNKLKKEMRKYGLKKQDMAFIREMIDGPEAKDTTQSEEARARWPYKGRPEEKSFLYEIVANKINGIDVDKFDYLARDCYHLGIQNNFDYHRFLKFARVCEVEVQEGERKWKRRQICTRDKEVGNLYDLFHTRYSLHRRACQHKVHTIIETMIAEAFVNADKHIQIKGKGGKKFTLSTAMNDMEAYTKLTDHVFEQILNSSSRSLTKSKKILEKIITRKHYRFLGETRPSQSIKDMISERKRKRKAEAKGKKPTKKEIMNELKRGWKMELAKALRDDLTTEHFEVVDITMDYGMKENKDPIDKVYFYTKTEPDVAKKISRDQVSRILPECFHEQRIRVYSREIDQKSMTAAMKHFDKWCENNGWPILQ